MTQAEQTRLWTWRSKMLQRAGESSCNVAQTCRHFGISRQAFYKWKRRFDEFGAAGLYDRPRTPRRSPRGDARRRRQQDSVPAADLPFSGPARSPMI
jgi:transposase-like protein